MTAKTGYRFLDPAAIARVKNMSMVARGVVEGFITGLHTSPYKGFSIEFAEHRNYAAGDNIRHLDWRMLARTDRLYVKQYEEETNLRAQVVLDVSRSMLYHHGQSISKLHYGAYLTAILAYLMTRQQDAVGLTTFDDQLQLDMPAGTSPRHFGEMMRQLEHLCDTVQQPSDKQESQQSAIADTLHRLAERFKRRCLIVLISDLYDDPENVIRALHHFRHRRHDVILFHVFDPTELDFSFRETMRFVDMETGQQLQVDPGYVREDYLRRIGDFCDRYRRACNDSQIDYVITNTAVPYDMMLARYLSKRSEL